MADFSQSVEGSYNAVAGSGATASVIVGFSAEQIALLLGAATAAQQARIDDLAGQLTISREAVVGFLRTLREDEGPTERLPEKLALIARRYQSMMERLGALDPEDPEAQRYLDEARRDSNTPVPLESTKK